MGRIRERGFIYFSPSTEKAILYESSLLTGPIPRNGRPVSCGGKSHEMSCLRRRNQVSNIRYAVQARFQPNCHLQEPAGASMQSVWRIPAGRPRHGAGGKTAYRMLL